MRRVYQRRFDWDEAQARYDAGEKVSDLAAEFGVTTNAVYRVVIPGWLEREAAYTKEWQARGRCDDCGGPMNNGSRTQGSRRCKPCADLARATSVGDGELRCVTCGEWKPDEEFPYNRGGRALRRGRHSQCRSCQTIARRSHRRRNREQENARDRAYKARKRSEARAA